MIPADLTRIRKKFYQKYFVLGQFGQIKLENQQRFNVQLSREAGVSQHYGGIIEGIPSNPPYITALYRIKGFKGGPHLGSYYAERPVSRTVHGKFSISGSEPIEVQRCEDEKELYIKEGM